MNSEIKSSSDDRQLLELSKDYLERVKSFAKGYEQAIVKLDQAREKFERVKSWQDWLRVFIPLITAILILFSAALIPCGTNLKFAGVEILRNCP